MKRVFCEIMPVVLLTCTIFFSFKVLPAEATPRKIVVPNNYLTIQDAVNAASSDHNVLDLILVANNLGT